MSREKADFEIKKVPSFSFLDKNFGVDFKLSADIVFLDFKNLFITKFILIIWHKDQNVHTETENVHWA